MENNIYITGDIHGNVDGLLYRLDAANIPKDRDQIIILLGDVGLNYYFNKRDDVLKSKLEHSGRTYFCIHGNHEERPQNLSTYEESYWNGGIVFSESKYPHVLFAQDGGTFNIYGKRFLVLGGAYSVDKPIRVREGMQWFKDEQISDQDKNRILNSVSDKSFDYVLSHTCPLKWQPTDLFIMADQNQIDNSMEKWLSEVETRITYGQWCFAHYHDDRSIGDHVSLVYRKILKVQR